MYAIAIIGDILSLIPFVNVVSTPITAFILTRVCRRHGIDLWSTNNAAATLASFVLELIPGISFIPIWTIRVWFAQHTQKGSAR